MVFREKLVKGLQKGPFQIGVPAPVPVLRSRAREKRRQNIQEYIENSQEYIEQSFWIKNYDEESGLGSKVVCTGS